MDSMKDWADTQKDSNVYDTDLDGIWDSIAERLDEQDKKKGKKPVMWVRYAAAILLLAVTGFTFYYNSLKNNPGTISLESISMELADAEVYYSSLYGEKLEMIQSSGVQLDEEIYADLHSMDSVYKDLKTDLKDNVDNEEVVQAMLENYRMRVQILERILQQIEEKEGNNTTNDERSI